MQEINLRIRNKRIENKLNKLASVQKKSVDKIILDILDKYDDSDKENDIFLLKYKKLDPFKHSKEINFNLNNFNDSDEIKPFENIKNTAKYAKMLRVKSWK